MPRWYCLLLLFFLARFSSGQLYGVPRGNHCAEFFDTEPADCSIITNCTTCLSLTECGWCDETDPAGSFCVNVTQETENHTCQAAGGHLVAKCAVAPVVKCGDMRNCTSCLDTSPLCVWCQYSSQYCFNKTTKSPSDCPGLVFEDSCADEDECMVFTECEQCVGNSKCGWCDNTCLSGNNDGPSDKEAKCQQWLFDSCKANCSDYTSCGSCEMRGVPCQWCNDSQSGHCYDTANEQCATPWTGPCPQVKCSKNTDCHTCVQVDECGWCKQSDNTATCENLADGPQCSSLNVKVCDETCHSMMKCEGCLNVSCGWCKTSNKCMPRTAGVCPEWTSSCNAPACAYSTCDMCVEDPSCCWNKRLHQCSSSKGTPDCELKCPEHSGISPLLLVGIIAASIGGVAAAMVGFVIFYRVYWVRRHYFERLE